MIIMLPSFSAPGALGRLGKLGKLGLSRVLRSFRWSICSISLLLALPRSSPAIVSGGGDATTDCLIELDGVEPDADAGVRACTDCDPACDRDGVRAPNGSCTFVLAACVNQRNVEGCAPAVVKKASVKPPGLGIPAPIDLGGSASCGASASVVVRTRRGGTRPGRKRLKLTAVTAAGSPRRRDVDRLRLSCVAQAGACPGAPAEIPTVTIIALEPGATVVRGAASGVDPAALRISGWARTDRWYPQPALDRPFTALAADGTWSYTTYAWEQVAVLLVDDRYALPAASIDYHPATDPGVVAWAEQPPSKELSFAGHRWRVKDSAPFATDPGPCVFSRENVWVAADGLHLSVAERAATWTCAEAVLDGPRGYGAYTFQIAARLDALDPREVFSPFLFESPTREIDIEFSRALASPFAAQYVVQPFGPGNLHRFDLPAVTESTHRIVWRADAVEFVSWRGFGPFPPATADVLQAWTYTGPDIPLPGRMRTRINLWLAGGPPPASGTGSEVVVRDFAYDRVP
jgi:hypothetical protein